MNANIQNRLRNAKRRIERRLDGTREDRGKPMFAAASFRVEMADKVRAIGTGGIGLVHQLAQQTGLVKAIDRRLHLLKVHRPYHESDRVLNLAYNAMCDGIRLEDIELRRNDEVFLDALGMVVIRKTIAHEKGQKRLFDEVRYFFYITNDWACDAEDVIFEANARCDQENLIAQLAGGVRALSAPVDNLNSNWAYMVMTLLAWNLKAWYALWLPEEGRWREKHRAEKHRVLRMEFRTFLNAFIKIPCQIVRSGRKLIYRVLSYNPHLPVFFRLSTVLRC